MSSRNVRLAPAERERATALYRALRMADDAVAHGERDPVAVVSRALSELRAAGVEAEYFELVSAETLAPLERVDGPALAVVAGRVGGTRLIDNQPLSTAPAAGSDHNGRR
jgi:pantoate--beta-alanine ligase